MVTELLILAFGVGIAGNILIRTTKNRLYRRVILFGSVLVMAFLLAKSMNIL